MNTGTTLLIIGRASVLLYGFLCGDCAATCLIFMCVWVNSLTDMSLQIHTYDSSHDIGWWVNFVLVS